MNNDDAYELLNQQILKLAKSTFFLWILSIILVTVASYTNTTFLNGLTLGVLGIMFLISIKFFTLIVKHFTVFSKVYGPHPKSKRNSTTGGFVNLGLLALVIYLFAAGSSNWFIIPLILISLFIFVTLANALSGG